MQILLKIFTLYQHEKYMLCFKYNLYTVIYFLFYRFSPAYNFYDFYLKSISNESYI